MQMKEAHYPGTVPIDAYGNGGFRFAGMAHKGSIMALPSGIYAWHLDDAGELSPEAFARVFAELEPPQLMLIGTGVSLAAAPTAVRLAFQERTIGLETMDTGAAARTYNVLLAEGRAVGAALLAVE
jgi:uncharacterized protein